MYEVFQIRLYKEKPVMVILIIIYRPKSYKYTHSDKHMNEHALAHICTHTFYKVMTTFDLYLKIKIVELFWLVVLVL